MKKVFIAVVLSSICFVVVGSTLLYSNYLFYKKSLIIPAIVTKIDEPDFCYSARGCKWSRQVFFTFQDPEGKAVAESKEIDTITLISGIITEGDTIKVLYRAKPVGNSPYDTFIKNLGPAFHEIEIYSWHYWGYPILTILCGPLLYWIYKKLEEKRREEKVI
ncbi:MAG: hypothetical protein WC794_01715 [Candidatus Doudnabacteria bacterium]|jgi:hypothetical protein